MAKKSKRGGQRDGAGRPKEIAAPVKVTLMLSKTSVVAVDMQAHLDGTNRSQVLRNIVEAWAKDN